MTARWEARPAQCRPGWKHQTSAQRTFSVGIGRVGSRAAAIYRVKGNVEDEREVDALAARLVRWLNHPRRPNLGQTSPSFELEHSNDKSAKIVLTPAGRKAGWVL